MPQGSYGIGSLDSRYESKRFKNVRDYGAKGDGSTDDTAEITAAYNACDYGDTLFFPSSTAPYVISSKLRIAKRISILGEGFWSQIYQSADDHLFHFDYHASGQAADKTPAAMNIENIALASIASSEPYSLMFFDESPYNAVRNVFMKGGYYGVYLYGALGNAFYNLYNFGTFSKPTSTNQYWVYGERAYSKSINHTSFYNPVFQTGTRGIYITDNHSEGGVGIWGGIVEGMTAKGVYLSGIIEGISIDRLHTEGDDPCGIELVSCKNGEISNCYSANPQGIVLTGCSRIKVSGGYASYITSDSTSRQIKVENLEYGYTLSLESSLTRLRDLASSSAAALGGYGMYDGDSPYPLNTNGDLESWSGGAPVGYTAVGTVAQETTIKRSGSSSAKLTGTGSGWNVLRYDLSPYKYGQKAKPVSIRAYAYKPAGGVNPRIALYYNSWASGVTFQDFSLPEGVWTPINGTFNVPASSYTNLFVLVGSYNKSGVVYIDDILVSEEQF